MERQSVSASGTAGSIETDAHVVLQRGLSNYSSSVAVLLWFDPSPKGANKL